MNKRISVQCKCGKVEIRTKEVVSANQKRNDGIFLCRACSLTDEGRKKISQATSYERSDETKQKMSNSSNRRWNSPEGLEERKVYSKRTAKQHASTNMDKSKRKVLYFSKKNNNAIRVCLSSAEFIACEDFFEKDDNIESYETQYYYEVNDRPHSLDVLLTFKNGSKKVIEIKPRKRINEERNVQQLSDSRQYAESQGWDFELWTEEQLGIKKWKIARDRADAYRKEFHTIDYAPYRKERDKQRTKRHYDDVVSKDKVIVYCDHCKTYHTQLRITYNRNVKKNGRFICIRENGSIIGKKSRKPKENPHGPDFKQCTGPGSCGEIKSITEFSKGKCICKPCRSNVYKNKYKKNNEFSNPN